MRKLQQNKTKEQQEMIHEIARNRKKKTSLKSNSTCRKRMNTTL